MVEYTPKKVFVLENGTYLELSCTEFRQREDTYRDRRFVPLHGMLMEVPEDAYKAFYKRKRREKYLKNRSEERQLHERTPIVNAIALTIRLQAQTMERTAIDGDDRQKG